MGISIYSCIFYFLDNDTAGTEESLELFFVLLFCFRQQVVVTYQNFRAYQVLERLSRIII